MAITRGRRWGSTTPLSWALAAVLASLLVTPSARADEVPALAARRHQLGLQVGGSSVFQVGYRYRFVGPVRLDVGGLGVPHSPINLSVGLVVAPVEVGRFFPYAGLGLGHAGIERTRGVSGCYPDQPGCPTSGDYLFFAYARVGVGLALDGGLRHTVGLDVGGWWGRHQSRYNDGAGSNTSQAKTILWPMAGLSYLYAF